MVSINQDGKVLRWRDMTPWPEHASFCKTPHIVAYLRHMLEKYEESDLVRYLVFPSPIALSGFFKCSESEVLEALEELKRQGYEYEYNGKSEPLTVWDPLIRVSEPQPRESMQWQWLQQMIANPIKLLNAG